MRAYSVFEIRFSNRNLHNLPFANQMINSTSFLPQSGCSLICLPPVRHQNMSLVCITCCPHALHSLAMWMVYQRTNITEKTSGCVCPREITHEHHHHQGFHIIIIMAKVELFLANELFQAQSGANGSPYLIQELMSSTRTLA